MKKIWRDEDIDLSVLRGRTVGIIGYGIQGRPQALNLRDSGLKVVVGGRENGKGIPAARKDGFEAFPIGEAAARSDVLFILTPDETHTEVLTEHVTPALKKGAAIGFACGFSLTFSKPPLPGDADVIMVSPKGPGKALRQRYVEGSGLPALVAIARDATGGALDTALAYAKAIGCGRLGVIESSFEEEAHTDLFGEQAVLCGGIPKLMETGFLMLVEAGYSPEAAYIECVWEAKAIVDLIFERGIEGMYAQISPTARYGGLTRGGRVINETARGNMRDILDEIRDGTFAGELPEGAPRQPGAAGLIDARLDRAWLRLRSAFAAAPESRAPED